MSEKKKQLILFCFTPAVSLVTFILEATFAFYSWLRYRATIFGKLMTLFLVLLGIFQLAEFSICSLDANALCSARIAFTAVAFLPTIGLHGIALISAERPFIKTWYTLAAAAALPFILSSSPFNTIACMPKFVAFEPVGLIGEFYYYAYMIMVYAGLIHLFHSLHKKNGDKILVRWYLAAYLASLAPLLFVQYMFPAAASGTASIYCGFAIFTAIIMMWKVLPRYEKISERTP